MRDGKAGPGGGPGMCGGRRLPSCPELRGLPAGSPELKHPRLVKRPTNGDGARRDAEQGWRRPGALLGRRRPPSAAEPPLSGGAPRQHGSRAAADGVIYGGGGRKVRLHFWNGGERATKTSATKVRSPGPSPPQRTQPSAPRWSLRCPLLCLSPALPAGGDSRALGGEGGEGPRGWAGCSQPRLPGVFLARF